MCKYTSPHELIWSTVKIFCCHCSSQKQQWEKIKAVWWHQAWRARDATARAIPFICTELAFHLVPRDSSWQSFGFVCHAMRGDTARLVFYQQASSFVSHLTDGGTAPSHRFTSHDWTPCFVLGVGSGYRLETRRKKYVTRREHTWCVAKKPGPR